MKTDSLKWSKKIHIVGIGGIGISALACILSKQGRKIVGSDAESTPLTTQLSKMGITVQIGHRADNLSSPDLVIHSLAIPDSNIELQHARKMKIPVISYPEAVGRISKENFTIAVCGTHGKSTVTALISKILIENGFDPTVIVGTKLRELGDLNFRLGNKKLLILEACEYMRAFLHYSPRIILLNSLDPDHMDYYKNYPDYLSAFKDFCQKLPRDGYFVGNVDDEDVHTIMQELQNKKFPSYNTFSYASNYDSSDFNLIDSKILSKEREIGKLNLKIPGQHNRMNALAAFSVARTLGIAPEKILNSINNYEGAFRRFELKGKIGHTIFIDDYGHHPAEIKATLQAVCEKFPGKKICVVFQPHQYSRTKYLLKEFGKAFGKSDCIIIPNIYAARDSKEDKDSMPVKNLIDEIKKNNSNVVFGDGLANTIDYLTKNRSKFDVILTMGAGDIWKIPRDMLKNKSGVVSPT